MPEFATVIGYGALLTIVVTLMRIAWIAGQGYKELKYLSSGHEELKNDIKDTRDRVITVERDVAVVKRVVGINGAMVHAQE